MDNSRVYQSNQEYSCGSGTALLNIFNGRLLYNYPLSSIGSGNYQIDVSLVFNSHYQATDFDNKKVGFGNGWKLNIQQYLFKYLDSFNIPGFNNINYVYVDASFIIHRFIPYKEQNNIKYYYDDSGTGLILSVNGNEAIITDDTNNKLVFTNERLSKIISGSNDSICKEIIYDSKDNIVQVHDSRKPNQKICFEYCNDQLSKVYTTNGSISNHLTYEEGLLTTIKVKAIEKEKDLHHFIYFNNKLLNVINCEDLQALKIDYDNKQVSKISIGAMKKEIVVKEEQANDYCGEDIYAGNDTYVSSPSKGLKEYKYTFPNSYIKEAITYNYHTYATDATNKKGYCIRYCFDTTGKTLSTLEKQADTSFYTLSRPTGYRLSEEGQATVKLNNKKGIVLSNNTYQVPSSLLNQFITIFDKEEEKYSDTFNISFWLLAGNNKRRARLEYSLGNDSYSEYVRLEDTSPSSWQKVEIPLHLRDKQKTLKNVKIILDINDNLNNEEMISDVRINKGGIQEICIDNTVEGNDEYKYLKLNDTLYYYDVNQKNQTLSPDFYLTQNDIVATYKSLFYNKQNNQSYYDLYYCNKTKVKNVYWVSIEKALGTEYRFSIDNENIPNYHFRMLDLVSDGTWMVSEVQHRYHFDSSINKYYLETKNAIGLVEDLDVNKRLPDSKASLNYTWVNEDGTSRATKHTKTISEDNIIKTKTEHYYDTYGNLEKVVSFDEDKPNGETISTLYSYHEDSAIDRELISSITKNNETTSCIYTEEGYIKEQNQNKIKVKYHYNEFNDLEKLEFIDRKTGKIMETNYIGYDKGNINLLKSSNDISYGFVYNGLSELSSVYKNKKQILNFQTIKSNDNDIDITKLYQTKYSPIITTSKYDKYGKEISNQTNDKETTFIYEYNGGILSRTLERVKKVNDPYANQTYTYSYDDDSDIKSTTVKVGDSFEVTTSSDNAKTYNIKNDNKVRKLVITKDEESKNLTKSETDDEWTEIEDLSYTYHYDTLGRPNKKEGRVFSYGNTDITVNKGIEYEQGTTLPTKTSYTVTSKCKNKDPETATMSYTNDYTSSLVTKVVESGKRFIENPENKNLQNITALPTRTYYFSYDALNRLTREQNPLYGNLEYRYGDKSGMIEEVYLNNILIKSLEYESGRLTKIINDGIISSLSYDNYGNILKTNDGTLKYNPRNSL